MATPTNSGQPRIPNDGISLVHVVERIVEYIHLTSQHRDEGRRPALYACAEDPCATWRRFIRESGWLG